MFCRLGKTYAEAKWACIQNTKANLAWSYILREVTKQVIIVGMKHLYFCRHGLTEMNVTGQFSGQIETNLTAEGQAQAKKAGQAIKANLPKIDLIICSPYKRARDTAQLIAGEIGYPEANIQTNDLLIERSFGVLEGTPGKEFFKNHSYQDLDSYQDVEPIEQVQQRADKFYEYLKMLKQYDNILVVGHGASGRALRRVVNGQPFSYNYDPADTQLPNASVIILVWTYAK